MVEFQRGFDITKAQQKEGQIPVVSSSGVNSYHAEAKVNGPGVVIGRKGSLGTAFFMSGDYWPHDTTLWSKDLKGNDARFVYYFVQTMHFENYNVGNANPTLNRNHIHDLEISFPGVNTQLVISNRLQAYDDLIENNQRRIKLLEEAARLIYREWFVRLRFPGHEHAKIVDGVPEGWSKKGFSQLADFINGYPFAPDELGDDGKPIIKIPELRDGPTAKTPRNPGDKVPEKYLVKYGDLLFSWSGTLLVNFWFHLDGLLNQHLFNVLPKGEVSRAYLCLALWEAMKAFENETTGATMRHIRKSALEKVETLVPDSVAHSDFEEAVQPIFQQIGVLTAQNRRLSEARDLLLPRLLSGETEV